MAKTLTLYEPTMCCSSGVCGPAPDEALVSLQDTIARAKKRLVQVGFLDVVTQGSFTKAGRFRYSDRWRTYDSGALFSETGTPTYDGPLPGYCHYANIAQYNAIRAKEAEEAITEDAPRQLNLFRDYANTA